MPRVARSSDPSRSRAPGPPRAFSSRHPSASSWATHGTTSRAASRSERARSRWAPGAPRCLRLPPPERTRFSRTSPTRLGPWRRSLADGRRSLGLILPVLAAAATASFAAGPRAAQATDARPVSRAPGPPFDLAAPTPHRLSFTFDTSPARDVLALLGGAPDAPATLRHLKASANATAAIRAEGLSPDDFYGRLVSTIAGTPDPLLSTFIAQIPYFTRVLDAVETDGKPGAVLEGRRIASLLPTGTPVTASFVIVPFLGVSGFAEV